MSSILGKNYLLSNAVKGIANPSVGYTNSNSLDDVQSRVHSDGALYQLNNAAGGDSFSFSSGNGSAIFATDKDDKVTLTGLWKDSKEVVTDSTTGISGKLYTNDKGEKAVISGEADVTIEKASSPLSQGIIAPSANKISHGGQWEPITGGDKNSTLTLDKAKAALTKEGINADTKEALQKVVNNWNLMAFTNDQEVTLNQMQDYGDGKPVT
jgi:hypothetical protein